MPKIDSWIPPTAGFTLIIVLIGWLNHANTATAKQSIIFNDKSISRDSEITKDLMLRDEKVENKYNEKMNCIDKKLAALLVNQSDMKVEFKVRLTAIETQLKKK